MKIAFNPSTVAALTSPPNNKDITFDLKGHNIFARGVEFKGTDTNTWRPVVDSLTSDSTTSSLSAKQGKVLKALIDNKSNSGHTHDDRYLKLTGGTLTGNLTGTSATFSGRFYGNGDDEGIIIKPASNGYAGLILGAHGGERSVFYFIKGNPFWRYNNGTNNLDIKHPKKAGTIALTSDIPTKGSWNYDDRYLRLSGGTMTSDALITFADSGSWGTDKGPQGARGGLKWSGQSDYAKLYAEETAGDNLDLVIQFGDDNSNGLSIRNKSNIQTSYISASGVITTSTFKGNLDWSYITNKPSSYTPSAHTHAWNSLTHSSTTANQAILTNGSANGWKLYTLNISAWDNAANKAHSHSNKSVLDGITSTHISNWNTAYTFVHTITGTDTDKVINKWDEIVNFLAGITEDNKLNTLLNSKLSVYELADKTNVGTIKNNGIYYSTTDASSGTLTNSPFNNGFALINMTSYDGGDDLRRSRLAFNAYGEIKVSDDRGQSNTAETWYNVLTSKNSGISGSTIKLNGTSITVYSSGTADDRYVKKSGDTMSGVLTIDTTNFGALTIKRNDDANGASIQFRGKSSVYGYIGLNNSTKDKQFLRWNSDTSRSYIILDTSSTYTSSGKGFINGSEITQVSNADTTDGVHLEWAGELGANDYSWLAGWTNDGKKIKAVNKNQFATSGHTHDGRYVRAFGTSNDNIDSDWGQSFKTFDPIPSGTPPEQNPNISLLSIGENFNRRKQLAFIWNNDNIYYRRRVNGSFSNWRRLAFANEIPGSLKNPHALTISLNGTSQGPYDGSAAKSINITPGSIGAATSGHNHDGRYVYNYGGTQMDGASRNKNALGMSTTSGISGDWWHILQAAWNDEYRWNSQIAFPTQNRNGMYYRSGLDDNTKWGAWVKLLDTGNSYVTNGKGVINGTTITQVDNATNATNSTNARKLVNWYSARPTSLNAQFGDGSLRIFYATSSTTEGKSPNDATVLHLAWDNNGGWDSQLAVNSPSSRIYSRSQNGGTWQPWKTLAFTTDIPSSLRNPHSLTLKANGTTLAIYDGSSAKEANFTYANVGAASASHTHSYYAVNENYGGFKKAERLPTSGFYQSNESESGGNAPWKGWMHLINCQHSNTGNNYALQIAASFSNNNIFKIRVTNNNVNNAWRDIIHSGNIGSQSVNYANSAGNSDKVDGFHAASSNKPWGTIPVITTGGWMDIGKHLEFHFDNTTGSDYSTILRCTGNYSNIVNLPSVAGTLALISDIPSSVKNPNAIKFKDINGNVVTYDGSAAKDLTSGTYIAKLPYGFASFASGVSWGNTTGTSFASWNDSTGGSIDFRRDNPSSGKMSIKVDGRVYVNEGRNPVLSAESNSGFWGMRTPDGGNEWIRTPDSGLIPYVPGGAGGGHSSLGTSGWYFSTAYIDKVYGSLKGNADTASSANKLTTARNIALGTDLRGSANFDGSGNITINANINACSVSIGSTNGLPFKRIAHFETGNSWNDNALLLYISEGYISGRNGICRVEFRTDYISSSSTSITASAAVRWLVRNGYGLDSLYAGYYVTAGKAYIDIYLKTTGSYQGTVIRVLQDSRGGINSNVQLINSYYHSDTNHKEAYSSIEAASTSLYNRAYTKIVSGSDVGIVSYSNSAGSVHWNNVTNKPSAFTPAAHTHTWTSITDKIVAGNEFNIVSAGFKEGMWFNYLPINDRSKTATVQGYHFGNGNKGYTNIKAAGFIKNGSNSSYVLLGDGGHKTISSLSVNYANSAGSATSATKVIVNQHTSNDINYPLVWSNQANTSNVTENQLYKSWADLYYNPKNKRLTVGGSVVSSSFVKSGGTSQQLLRADGGVAAFNWSGQSGQPTWLWGGNDFNSYYVYNPSNFRVAYAASAGNADTLDGEHAINFVRAGAIEAGDGDLNALDTYSFIKSVNSKVASHSPKSATGWYNIIQAVHRNGQADGASYIGQIALGMTTNTDDMFFRGKRTDSWKTVIHSGNIGSQTVANAYHLRINSANSWSTWNWSGQSGQPSWLWGSNDGTNMYVWNPSNFNVNTAQYLRSLGNKNCQTGRTQAYGDVYTYNTRDSNTGSATTYSSVIGFGRGTGGTVEIAGGWCNTNLYWRSLRDCCEDWFAWRTVLDDSNYASVLNNTYLPLAGGTMKGNARIGHGSGSLYIGNSGNDGWLYVQDMASQAGEANWKIYANGFATFKNLTVNGPTVVNGSTTLNGATTLNGLVTNNRGILPASYDVNKNNIACYVWGDAMSTGVTAITDALDPKYVSVHHSQDNGATWHDMGMSVQNKFSLYANNGSREVIYLGANRTSDLAQIQKNQLMVTFEIPNNLYSQLCWASIEINNGVQTVCTVEIIAKDGTIKNTFTKNLQGWSMVNYINFWGGTTSVVNIGQDSARFVRFKFKHDANNTQVRNALIHKIRLFSFTKFAVDTNDFRSTMAYAGHLYKYDSDLNIKFPNAINCTTLNVSSINGTDSLLTDFKQNGKTVMYYNSEAVNINKSLNLQGIACLMGRVALYSTEPFGTESSTDTRSVLIGNVVNYKFAFKRGIDGQLLFMKWGASISITSVGCTIYSKDNLYTSATIQGDGKSRIFIYQKITNAWYEFYCG